MPLGSALARLRQTQLCPTATWVFSQSRRLAAGAGGLCSSPSSWLPPEVRSASLGAGEEHRENTAGRVGITGQTGVPREPPSSPCDRTPHGREAARTTWQRAAALCQVPWLGDIQSEEGETPRWRLWSNSDTGKKPWLPPGPSYSKDTS